MSICDTDWAKHVEKLATASLDGLNVYALSDEYPDPASIQVYVDGVEWTTGWSYDAASNEVIIEAEVEANSEVVVRYGVLHSC